MKPKIILIIGILITGLTQAQNKNFTTVLSTAFTSSAKSGDVSALSVSPVIELSYRFDNNWKLSAKAGLSYLSLKRNVNQTESKISLGNTILSLGSENIKFIGEIDIALNINAGIPLATNPGSIPQNRLSEYNLNNANSAFGWREPLIWIMNIVPVSTEINLTKNLNGYISINAKFEPGYLISINSRPSRFSLLTITTLNFNFNPANLEIGWSSFYSGLSLENNNHVQNSVFAGITFKIADKDFGFSFNLNIDKPNGVMEKTTKPFWGVSLGTSF